MAYVKLNASFAKSSYMSLKTIADPEAYSQPINLLLGNIKLTE